MLNPITGALLGWATRLRFPVLFGITATLFIVDVIVPDFIPLVDELLLGLATVLLASRRKKPDEPEIDEQRPELDGEGEVVGAESGESRG